MSKLEKQLGLTSVVAISVSAMLGSGIFVLPGLAAAKTGPSVWLAYMAAGLSVLPAALSKAELATAMPTSGGAYVFLDRTFGPLVGTISGIGLWLSLLLKSAFALVGFSAYLMVLTAEIPIKVAALVLLAVIIGLNIRGVRRVSQVQMAVVGIAVIGLTVLFVLGLQIYDGSRLTPMFTGSAGGFLGAAGFVFVSYAGVTKIAAIAEEVKRPERNLPLGMLLSLLIAVALYGGTTFMMVATIPMSTFETDNHPVYSLAHAVGGHEVGIAAAILGVVTMASMASVGLLTASRFPFAMSRDQLLPSIFHHLHSRFLTPVVSILVSAATIATAILVLDVERIAKLASTFMIILFLMQNVAVLVLRETNARWYKPTYRSPFYPWIQVVGVVLCTLLLAVMGPLAIVAGATVAIPGLALYLFYSRSRTERRGVVGLKGKRREVLRPITAEMKAVTELISDANVVVTLFGSERTPEALVEHGAALADGGKVLVALLTELPEQVFLDAVKDDPKIASIQRRVEAVAEAKNFSIQFDAIATRDIGKTVYELSSRVHCEWSIMEWTGRTRYSFSVGNPLGWLKNHLSCNLAVYYDAGVRYFRRILVYAEPGPHDALVAHTADHLAQVHSAELTFVRFVADDAPLTRSQTEADYLDQVRQLCESSSEPLIVRGRDEVKALITASAGFDLLVTAEPRGTLKGQIFGLPIDRLTAGAACSVLRLQTPREQIHRALDPARSPTDAPKLADLLERRCVGAGLERRKKDALFEAFADTFAAALPNLKAEKIVAALQERERSQNTAVGHGVALPHATLESAERTYLGVFTTASPIDYEAPDGVGVDVFFVTIGPPSERQTHLFLLAGVSRLVLQTGLLGKLRNAERDSEIVEAMENAMASLGM